MKRSLVVLLLLSACATAPGPSPSPRPSSAPPRHPANAMTPLASVPKTIAEPRIRVGMLSDQANVTFARIPEGYFLVTDSGPFVIRRGFTVTAPLAGAAVRYAVQAAAISDKPSAEALTEKIRTEMAQRADMVFDPSASNGGIYRILIGDFPDAQSAQPLRGELTSRGYAKETLVVRRPSEQPFEKTCTLVDDEGDRVTVTGGSFLVMPVASDTITVNEKLYRSGARIFLNPRGLLNIINELNLEDYLRGVVPAELGPKIYDELEALKAQAVAARTYAVRNLGQFATEGFDICPGPACQAYSGFSGEAALSDQAVRETAGLIATYEGRPIDALYTATCGGETSDVATMFPGRNEPYLKRSRCVETEITTLAGRSDSGLLTETQVNARLFAAVAGVAESGASWSASDVAAAVAAAARAIGATPPASAPASSRRGDVLRYLADVLHLGEWSSKLMLPEDRKYFFAQSTDPEAPEYRAAAFLVKYGIWPAQHIDRIDLAVPFPREELYALLAAWMREHELLTESVGKIAAVDGRRVGVKTEGKVTPFVLPERIPVFRKLGDRFQEYASVPVMIGDRATVVQNAAKTPVALIVIANYDGAAFDRTSSFANWTRSYRADELVKSMNNRNPIQQLLDLRVITVDASQRIAEMEVTAEGGRKFMLRGLPIRWSLNVPDNLFVFEKTKDPDGMDRYTFFGKGWGHGVGMCQVGAYGMAFRGSRFDQILKNYYAGIEIVPMSR